jgi:hydroxymethylbilane synthase
VTKLRLGTRASPLALVQANLVRDLLLKSSPGLVVELMEINSSPGDVDKTSALTEGRGWFTSAIQDALVSEAIDIAVHSYKDLPTALNPGLTIAAVPERADPRDVIVSRGLTLSELSPGATVGTSSPRREVQLLLLRPDLDIQPIRGNVGTRISKVDSGDYDATVLALAGISRLGIPGRANQVLTMDEMLPAPAQGALAVECRTGDNAALEAVAPLNHAPSQVAASAERAFLAALEAGCSFPAAAYASVHDEEVQLTALVASSDGVKRESARGVRGEAVSLGQQAAASLFRWLKR